MLEAEAGNRAQSEVDRYHTGARGVPKVKIEPQKATYNQGRTEKNNPPDLIGVHTRCLFLSRVAVLRVSNG